MRRIMLIGGGGHCRSIIDCAKRMCVFDEIGIIDTLDKGYNDVPVIGCDDDISQLTKKGWLEAIISVGSIGNTNARRKIYDLICKNGISLTSIIDPSAIIAEDVEIGEGTFIGKGVIINSGSRIEKCSIINTNAVVEHDCFVGEFSHISSGSILCGHVTIGSDSHVGAGSVLRQQITIGNRVLLGIGSVVTKDISSDMQAYGNPCRVKK